MTTFCMYGEVIAASSNHKFGGSLSHSLATRAGQSFASGQGLRRRQLFVKSEYFAEILPGMARPAYRGDHFQARFLEHEASHARAHVAEPH